MSRMGCLRFAMIIAISLAASPSAQTQAGPIPAGFGKGAYPVGTAFPNIAEVIEPDYPAAAIEARIQGEVRLEAVVGESGLVTDVRIVKSLDEATGLDASAAAAVRRWKFRPANIGPTKIAVVVPVRVTFHLHPPGNPAGKPFTESGLVGLDQGGAAKPGTPGLTPPMVTREVGPFYTAEAMRRKIQGDVELEVTVGVDGRVTAVRVTKSLDDKYGLDKSAMDTVRKWQFTPGRLNGVAVVSTIRVSLTFKLH